MSGPAQSRRPREKRYIEIKKKNFLAERGEAGVKKVAQGVSPG